MLKKIKWLWGILYCVIRTHVAEIVAIAIIFWAILSFSSLCSRIIVLENYYNSYNKKVVVESAYHYNFKGN